MNKRRRKEINKAMERIEELTWFLTALAEEEQEAIDNLPESLQCTDRGDAMNENIMDLEGASSELDDIKSNLQEITLR
jgi:hypothetical protein